VADAAAAAGENGPVTCFKLGFNDLEIVFFSLVVWRYLGGRAGMQGREGKGRAKSKEQRAKRRQTLR